MPRVQTFELTALATARLWDRTWPMDGDRPYAGLAVEVAIPQGGMCAYGLLGASLFEGSPGGSRASAPSQGGRWTGSLVDAIDEVHVGLPSEFRRAVLTAVAERAPSRQVDFDCAAHGMVGSSSALFGRLASALVQLHTTPHLLHDRQALLGVLEQIRG